MDNNNDFEMMDHFAEMSGQQSTATLLKILTLAEQDNRGQTLLHDEVVLTRDLLARLQSIYDMMSHSNLAFDYPESDEMPIIEDVVGKIGTAANSRDSDVDLTAKDVEYLYNWLTFLSKHSLFHIALSYLVNEGL